MPIFDIAIASLHLIFFDIAADVSIDDAAFTPLRPDLLRFAVTALRQLFSPLRRYAAMIRRRRITPMPLAIFSRYYFLSFSFSDIFAMLPLCLP
jgi:hypothetical protein